MNNRRMFVITKTQKDYRCLTPELRGALENSDNGISNLSPDQINSLTFDQRQLFDAVRGIILDSLSSQRYNANSSYSSGEGVSDYTLNEFRKINLQSDQLKKEYNDFMNGHGCSVMGGRKRRKTRKSSKSTKRKRQTRRR